jgi:hypothetical protein
VNISETKALKNNTVAGFFTNLTERGWALLNEKDLIATDCVNCDKYGVSCSNRLPQPCGTYGKLPLVKDNWYK